MNDTNYDSIIYQLKHFKIISIIINRTKSFFFLKTFIHFGKQYQINCVYLHPQIYNSMANKSHFNSGLRTLVQQRRDGVLHSSAVSPKEVATTYHALYIQDAVDFLKTLPDASIQLVLIDPPYNLDIDYWDSYPNYLEWARQWIDEIYRVMSDNGNCVIFGGFQLQDLKQGDLLEILHYARHNTRLRLVNLIVWHYKWFYRYIQ